MKNVKSHWLVLSGILFGILVGSVINLQHIDNVREAILGPNYLPTDLHANAKQINDALVASVKGSFLGAALDGIGRIFLSLLKMVVIPLVFFSIVCGICSMGGGSALGRIGLKTIGWYVCTSIMAIVTGLVTVNLLTPGEGTNIMIPTQGREAHPPDGFWDVVVNMVPTNVIESAAKFDMFGVIVFAILFGIFLTQIDEKHRAIMIGFVEGAADVMMKMTMWVISLAPVGIAGLVGFTVATSGPQIFLSLIGFILTVAAALGFHFIVSLPALCWVLTKRNPYVFMRAMSPALLTGFSTASSSGTLGVTIETANDEAGISNKVSSFVLPLGATVNMDGTALFECVTVLFIAQIHAATHPEFAPLTLQAQIMVVFLALAVSIGAAGIPHAGLVMMVIILNAVNLPLEYTALIWAVDRVLDMARTMTNIWSDSCGALVIAHSENAIDDSVLFDPASKA
ncbi:MAG: dicarboxylate/amino acid:cation symporter [Deltaproteobacteria bacterium]|nr:dicarboxylate/amino acid:cation symporter [Deltaproteobacteria bacterium]MBT6433209.1 dicarboxylate/amino acid:cation symporter [Deltaproteobacteria bacterium]